MKLETFIFNDSKHNDVATCISWNTSNEVYSCGDDQILMRWDLIRKQTSKAVELPIEIYPTDMDWFPINASSSNKQTSDLILLAAADGIYFFLRGEGKFHLLNKHGRLEKSYEAHKGAILCCRWNNDGSGFLTAGEDGQIKIWSRTGMLRSTLVTATVPLYCASFNPDGSQLVYPIGSQLIIKPLAPHSRPIRWKAHDGLILCLAWSAVNDIIISGAEDCHFCVWDRHGRIISKSPPYEYPITCLAWAPSGDIFAVGSFESITICDKNGFAWSSERRTGLGSLLSLTFSPDGSQLAGACFSGNVVFSPIYGQSAEWRNLEATTLSERVITVTQIDTETEDIIELPDRVVRIALGYNRLAVATPSRLYLYTPPGWNTPISVDLIDSPIMGLKLTRNQLAIITRNGLVSLYTWEGRPISTPKPAPGAIEAHVGLAPDFLAIRGADPKTINLWPTSGGPENNPVHHKIDIIEIGLSQGGPTSQQRYLAFIDRNKELWLLYLSTPSERTPLKLASQVHSIVWHSEDNMLASAVDNAIVVWTQPQALWLERSLVKLTTIAQTMPELGRAPRVISFTSAEVRARRSDGAAISLAALSPYHSVLHGYATSRRWSDALRLCRLVNETALWAGLAVQATRASELTVAEEAYAIINMPDKVGFIQRARAKNNPVALQADAALLAGRVQDAEAIWLQHGKVYQAIAVNLLIDRWDRALELATRHQSHIDTVLWQRSKYLESLGLEETSKKYLELRDQVDINEHHVLEKIEIEEEKMKAH